MSTKERMREIEREPAKPKKSAIPFANIETDMVAAWAEQEAGRQRARLAGMTKR